MFYDLAPTTHLPTFILYHPPPYSLYPAPWLAFCDSDMRQVCFYLGSLPGMFFPLIFTFLTSLVIQTYGRLDFPKLATSICILQSEVGTPPSGGGVYVAPC